MMSQQHLSMRLLPAEKLVTAPSDATSEVARAVSATERAIRKELELSRISVASSGVGDQQEADPEYQCPICLVASPSLPLSTLSSPDPNAEPSLGRPRVPVPHLSGSQPSLHQPPPSPNPEAEPPALLLNVG